MYVHGQGLRDAYAGSRTVAHRLRLGRAPAVGLHGCVAERCGGGVLDDALVAGRLEQVRLVDRRLETRLCRLSGALRIAVPAQGQGQEVSRQVTDQEQEVRHRLVPRHADSEMRLAN